MRAIDKQTMLLLLRSGLTVVATAPLLRLQLSTPFRRFCLSRMSAVTEPMHRRFIRVDNKEEITIGSSIETDDGLRFRIVSYNILAQVFVKSAYFPHSPKACLRWKARSEKVLTSLKSFKADFLCIQELDEYDTFYKINMENHGYSSIYIQRSGKKRDGCGIFYSRNSAELVLQEEIEYNDLVDSVQDGTSLSVNKSDDAPVDGNTPINDLPPKDSLNDSDRGDPNDPRVRLKRDCVGIMGAFKHKDLPDHIVIVANTHLYWDPAWADVKLAQAKYLLSRLAQFKAVVSEKFGCTPSVIVSGDFNSTPGDKVYQYIVSGDSSVSPPADDNSEMTPIPLRSVYAFAGGEPPFTNCTPGFTGTLDYIFFSPSGHLKPVSFLELPGPESSDVVGGLPNNHHPSDHLPIGADFEVTSISNQLENMSISNQQE